MKNRMTVVKTIAGIDSEEFFGTVVGPMAAAVLEMKLYAYLQSKGEGMTGADMRIVQFAIERAYGTATRSIEVTRVNEQDIVAEQLGHLDQEVLRQIASTNARRDDTTNN